VRILYLASFPADGRTVGGIETYGRELMRATASRGHEIACVDLYGPDIMKSLTVSDRIPRVRWSNRYYWWRGMSIQDYRYHNAVRRRSRMTIRRFAPDVIHCLHCYLGAAVADGGPPYVATCYGLEVVDVPPIRQVLQRAALIHSISDFTRARAEQVVRNGRHRVLSWGITAVRCPDAASTPTFDLITVGRVVRRKNIDTVLRALRSVPHVRYAVVGDGPELPSLRQFAAEYKMTNVEFFGAVSDEQKRELLSRSRLFVMCPRSDNDDVEGLGLVYYEAHGAGLPVIAARAGGAAEAVGDGGLLVADSSSEAEVLDAITTALRADVYARLCAAVAKRQNTHSWTRFIDGFEQLYSDAKRAARVAQS